MVASRGTLWNILRRSSGWFDSPVKGMISPTTGRVTRNLTGLLFNIPWVTQQKEVFKKKVGVFHPGINLTCCG
ncbi:hypothetical protein LOK49_LG12G02304 [Camellia lanceoleosa]|uniref:Uncharacterized protein n=1 Tax=Camellia lanceoleosa TaxID=1840588 RepID=A0ACC0FVA4_9ERIC|nr:hypothetical protein LOK49_LG12G02304 [Camellia lanceoleosa]